MKTEPECVPIKARDLVPHKHAVWCSVGGSKPFANPVYMVRWTDDGMISAALDCHVFLVEHPDAVLDCIVERTSLTEYDKQRIASFVLPPPPSEDDRLLQRVRAIAKEGGVSSDVLAKIRAELA